MRALSTLHDRNVWIALLMLGTVAAVSAYGKERSCRLGPPSQDGEAEDVAVRLQPVKLRLK